MMVDRGRAKRIVGGIYSFAAKNLYEPIVVRRAFPLFGGNLHEHVLEHGRRAVEAAAGLPILDMPVGTAFFTIEMARAHSDMVVGVDIAEGMVQRAHHAAVDAGVANLVAVRADAHHLPFGDGVFGAVVCSNGLQVIPGLDPATAELARVLAPGGSLFCSVVTLPIFNVLPRDHLPTVLRPGRDVAGSFERAGLRVTRIRRDRLATLIEAARD